MQSEEQQYSTDGFYVWMEDSASAGSGKTGLTLAIKLSKAGAAQATVTPPVTEIGEGLYWIVPFSNHRSSVGRNAWTFSSAGAFASQRIENVVAFADSTPPQTLIPTTVCFDIDNGAGTAVTQAQLAVGTITSTNHSYRTALRFDSGSINSAEINSAILRITKTGIIDAGETTQQFQVKGVKVDDALPANLTEFNSDISGLTTVDVLTATVEAVTNGNELAIDLTAMFSALASDSSSVLIYLTEYFGGGINFSSPNLEISATETVSDSDVNVISVAGAAVAGVADFKADVSALATAATQTTITNALTAIQGATFDTLTDSLEALRNRGDAAWITGGDATAAGQTTITNALTAIQGATFDTLTDSLEAIRNRGDAAWVTGAAGGDATAANQTSIIDALTAVKGATFDTLTDSLEALRNRGDAAWITATSFAELTAIHAKLPSSTYLAGSSSTDGSIQVSSISTRLQQQLADNLTTLAFTRKRATDWSFDINVGDISGLAWDEILFTLKAAPQDDLDSAALIQIKLTNGGAVGDGLTILSGAAALTATDGSIVVVGSDSVTVTILADATAAITPTNSQYWDYNGPINRSLLSWRRADEATIPVPPVYQLDVKILNGSGSAETVPAAGTLIVSEIVTRTIV